MTETKWPTSARLSTRTKMALQAAAEKTERSESWLIERALTEYLEREGYLTDKSAGTD